MSYKIDLYHLENSTLPDLVKTIMENENDFIIHYIPQNDKNIEKEHKNDIVIYEEENFLISIETFKIIIKNYFKKKVPAIIISNNREIFNVVLWMRNGASDYLVKQTLTKQNFINSINGSLHFVLKKKHLLTIEEVLRQKNKYIQVAIPKNPDWSGIENNSQNELSVVMIEILLHDASSCQYSKSSIDNIYAKIKNEASSISEMFGGKLWFWNNNYGSLVFHFGDKISCSVLAGIYFYNHFFQICLEKLKLNNILHFKICIHEGNMIFNRTNTDHITSDVINTLAHGIKIFKKRFLLCNREYISEGESKIEKLFSGN